MESTNINFCFVRHGYSCSNALSSLEKNNVITLDDRKKFAGKGNDKDRLSSMTTEVQPLIDPELTPIGVDASINNGCIISKIIKSLYKLTGKEHLKIDKMNIVGCSPLIRAMETAYYMTRKWNNPPNKIYVFPLLREIDERSDDKYSKQSRRVIDTKPGYRMKSLEEQKAYLQKAGLLNFFDFTFVEQYENLRKEPGDIIQFMKWFYKYFLPLVKYNGVLNIFITTHAGVLKDFSEEGFYNNSGFLINTLPTNVEDSRSAKIQEKDLKFEFKHYISFNNFLPKFFFKDYDKSVYNGKEYFCPSNRCGQLCSVARTTGQESLFNKKIKIECVKDNDDL